MRSKTAAVRSMRYDEWLDANEDFDLCHRNRNASATVRLEPDVDVQYEPCRTWDELFWQ